jgi:hypothetical protein
MISSKSAGLQSGDNNSPRISRIHAGQPESWLTLAHPCESVVWRFFIACADLK